MELTNLSREELLELLEIYAKNWLALDGLWFQSVEQELGMDKAMQHNMNVWRKYTVIEAKRIREFLGLTEYPGLEGLRQALGLRLYAPLNKVEIILTDNTLTFKTLTCRVQNARSRKNLPWHPCKDVGIIEYGEFAKTIDSRIKTTCISCHPDITDKTCACIWRFTLEP